MTSSSWMVPGGRVVACILFVGCVIASPVSAFSVYRGPESAETAGQHDRAAITASIAAARTKREQGESGFGNELRRAAAALARLGDFTDAASLMTELIENPETRLDRLDGLRQRGQYRYVAGDLAGAIADFAQIEEMCNDVESRAWAGSSYASAQLLRAELLLIRGHLEEALRVNELILDPRIRDSLDNVTVRGAESRKIRILSRMSGDTVERRLTERDGGPVARPDATTEQRQAQLLEQLDLQIARRLPTGPHDATLIRWMREAAQIRDRHEAAQTGRHLWTSDAYFSALSAIWADARFQADPEIKLVGHDLVAAAKARRDDLLRIEIAVEAIALLDLREHAWVTQAVRNADGAEQARAIGRALADDIKASRTRFWQALQGAEFFGRRDLAERALMYLIQITDDPAARDMLIDTLVDLSTRPDSPPG